MVPFNSINQSLSNRSKTKQTFSFSKSIRFAPNESLYLSFDSDAQYQHIEETTINPKIQELLSVMEKNTILHAMLQSHREVVDTSTGLYLITARTKIKVIALVSVDRYFCFDEENSLRFLSRPKSFEITRSR